MKRGLKFDILAQTDDVTDIELCEWPTQMFVRTYAAHGYLAKYGTILLPTATAARKGQGSKPLNTWPGKHLKMPTCSVLGCKNKEGGSFSFHIFPKDRDSCIEFYLILLYLFHLYHLFIHLFIYLFIYSYMNLFIRLCFYLLTYLFICIFIYIFIYSLMYFDLFIYQLFFFHISSYLCL